MNDTTMTKQFHGGHPMKLHSVWAMPVVALFLIGSWSMRVGRYQRRQGPSAVDRGEVRQALQR